MKPDDLLAVLFDRERERNHPALSAAIVTAIFAAGAATWTYVIGVGRVAYGFHDWTDINIPRLTFLQNALRAGEWPLHMGSPAALHGVTDRFLTLPDVITTPQSLLLLIMPVTTFILVDALIQYAIGCWGLWMLRRHFQWSLFAFAMVCAVFNFNGHILAHYSVGHVTWGAYFSFPLVLLIVFRCLDGDASWRSIAAFAAVLFYMVLAGGQHHMTWVLLFVLMLAPLLRQRAWWAIAAIAAAGLLSGVRLLPPVLQIGAFEEAGLVSDVIGYPSLTHLLEALISLKREFPAYNPALPANMWFFESSYYELTVYVGVVATIGIAVFGIYHWLRREDAPYRRLAVPAVAMLALSLGTVYRFVRATRIPLFESERYTSRMAILPLVLFMIMAATMLDRHLRERARSTSLRVVALVAGAFVLLDLSAGVRLWRVAVSAAMFPPVPFDPAAAAIAHHDDPQYTRVLIAGALITMITAVALAAMIVRERRSRALEA